MTRTMEIPNEFTAVLKDGGGYGYTVLKLTVLLYTSWLDGKISLGEEQPKDQLDEAYSRGFDFLKVVFIDEAQKIPEIGHGLKAF